MMVFKIIMKTIPYLILRFVTYLALTMAFLFYFFVCWKIFEILNKIAGENGWIAGVVLIFLGLMAIPVYRFVKSYLLYMIKAGHVAVVAELAANGSLPSGSGQITFGTETVKKHFATSNALYVMDNLITKSVKEIRRGLDRADNWFSFIPGFEAISKLLGFFAGLVLNYVDEAVLGYIYQKNISGNAWKHSADGIVLYVQNWKTILKSAGLVMLTLLVLSIVLVAALLMLMIMAGDRLEASQSMTGFIPVVIAVAAVLLVKWAVIDPIIMIYMVCKYFEVSLNTQPAFELYDKLAGMSSKFTSIIEKASVTQDNGVKMSDATR